MSKAAKVSDVVAPYFVEKLAGLGAVPRVSLLEVAELNPKRFTNPPKDNDTVSFIPMRAVEEETGRLDATEVRPWSAVRKGYTPFQEGDVIFAKITPCMENGKYAIAQGLHDGRAAGSTEFHVLRPNPMLDAQYLLYYLFRSDIRQAARHNMQGAAGQLRVPAKFFEGLEIPCPSVEEQRRIVAEIEEQLTRLEAGVAALKRVQANLKRYRASVIQAACNGALLSGAETSGGWRTVSLGDLAESGSYGTSVKCSYENAGVAVLRIPNVSNGRIELKDMKRAPEAYSVSGEDYLAPGDMLIIRTNGSKSLIGRGAVVLENPPFPLTYASYLIRFRLHEAPTLWRWVSLVLEYSGTRQWIEQHAASSAGQHNVSLSLLKAMPIPLPSEDTQRYLLSEVDRCLSVVDELENRVQADLARADRLRQAVLQHAFRGESVATTTK